MEIPTTLFPSVNEQTFLGKNDLEKQQPTSILPFPKTLACIVLFIMTTQTSQGWRNRNGERED
jgi:hypothetical protein